MLGGFSYNKTDKIFNKYVYLVQSEDNLQVQKAHIDENKENIVYFGDFSSYSDELVKQVELITQQFLALENDANMQNKDLTYKGEPNAVLTQATLKTSIVLKNRVDIIEPLPMDSTTITIISAIEDLVKENTILKQKLEVLTNGN